jgi:hypothetical protein
VRPQLLGRILDANPALAAWDARRRREEKITEIVRRHLPRPLAERVRVAEGEGAVLELAVEAGAVGAIVRQRSPDLIDALQSSGFEFNQIRVRVQVRRTAEIPTKTLRIQPDRGAIQPLASLARRLRPGPLKTALTRLVRRLG